MTFLTNIANILAKYWQVFLVQGIGYTLLLSVIAVAGGAFFGSLLALAKRSKLKILKAIVSGGRLCCCSSTSACSYSR